MTLSVLARPAAQEPLWVPPRYATPRDPGRLTLGPAVAKVARILGRPLIPWQQYHADVAGELNERGHLAHSLVVTTVQRQAGKTTLELATAVQRCLWRPNQRVWNFAQTGQDARDVWREFTTELMASPLKDLVVEWRKGNGQELLRFNNGSTFRPRPTTEDALHGKQSDSVHVDEGWSFDEPTGAMLFQAITPTKTTRPGAQTFVWSTMGSAASKWFHDLVDTGMDGDPGTATFYWGIPDPRFPGDPEADPDDDEVIARWHPGVGYLTDRESLAAARKEIKEPAEYARAYGNRRTGGRARLIPELAWSSARWLDEDEEPAELPAGRPAYGVGVYEPRDGGDVTGSLVAAVAGPDGRPVLEVVESRPGRAWLVDRVLELEDRGLAVAVNRRGPAGPVADALALAGVELLEGVDYPAACQDFWDRLCDREAREAGPRLHVRDHPAMDGAVDVAGRRFRAEGAWVWDARASTGDVSALEGGTLAVHALVHAPAQEPVGRSMFA